MQELKEIVLFVKANNIKVTKQENTGYMSDFTAVKFDLNGVNESVVESFAFFYDHLKDKMDPYGVFFMRHGRSKESCIPKDEYESQYNALVSFNREIDRQNNEVSIGLARDIHTLYVNNNGFFHQFDLKENEFLEFLRQKYKTSVKTKQKVDIPDIFLKDENHFIIQYTHEDKIDDYIHENLSF